MVIENTYARRTYNDTHNGSKIYVCAMYYIGATTKKTHTMAAVSRHIMNDSNKPITTGDSLLTVVQACEGRSISIHTAHSIVI